MWFSSKVYDYRFLYDLRFILANIQCVCVSLCVKLIYQQIAPLGSPSLHKEAHHGVVLEACSYTKTFRKYETLFTTTKQVLVIVSNCLCPSMDRGAPVQSCWFCTFSLLIQKFGSCFKLVYSSWVFGNSNDLGGVSCINKLTWPVNPWESLYVFWRDKMSAHLKKHNKTTFNYRFRETHDVTRHCGLNNGWNVCIFV